MELYMCDDYINVLFIIIDIFEFYRLKELKVFFIFL